MIEPNDYSYIQYLIGYLNGSVLLLPEKFQDTVLNILRELDVCIDRNKPNTNQD